MGAPVANLVIEFSANVARITSDFDKISQVAQQKCAQIDKAMGLVTTSLKALGAGFVVGLTLDAVKGKIDAAIQSAAGLTQIAQRTGATVESLSGLVAVARLSNTSSDELAGGLQKLSKALVDAKDGGTKTTAAFEAIGISTKQLVGLRPDAAFLLISQRMNLYADGAEKTAIAQALLGKSGANLLPVMNDLAAVGDLQVRVTAEQSRVADEYEKNLKRLDAVQNAVFKTIAMEIVPVLNVFIKAMIESATATGGLNDEAKSLAKDGSIRAWAEDAARAAAFVVDSFRGVASIFQIIGKYIGASEAALDVALYEKGLGAKKRMLENIREQFKADLNGILNAPSFSDKLEAQLAAARTPKPYSDARTESQRRTTPNFNPLTGGGAKDTAYESLIASIKKYNAESQIMLDTDKKVADYDKWDLEMKKSLEAAMKNHSAAQRMATAQMIDAAAARRKLAEETVKATKMEQEFQKWYGQFTQREQGIEAGAARDNAIGKWIREGADQAKMAEQLVSGSMQRAEDAISNFVKTGKLSFKDLFSFMADEFIRNTIKMAEKKFLLDDAGNFKGFGSLISSVGSFFGFGHANGMNYVPYDGYPAILHEGERVMTKQENADGGGRAGGGLIVDNSGQTFNVGQGVSRAEMSAAIAQANAGHEMRIRRLVQQGAL